MVELRKSKGLTPQQAPAQLEDTVMLGTMMLAPSTKSTAWSPAPCTPRPARCVRRCS
jgi:hypothetical protein